MLPTETTAPNTHQPTTSPGPDPHAPSTSGAIPSPAPSDPQQVRSQPEAPPANHHTVGRGDVTHHPTQAQFSEAARSGLAANDSLIKELEPLLALQRRLHSDPQARDRFAIALRAIGLGEEYVAPFTSFVPPVSGSQPGTASTVDADILRRLDALENLIRTQIEERAIAELKARYGDDAVDADLLRAKAKELGIPDLAAVYKILTYDSAQERAVQEYIAGKRRSPQATPLPGGAPAPARVVTDPPKTFREARELATQRLREVFGN